jgi:WD40 repeat protein
MTVGVRASDSRADRYEAFISYAHQGDLMMARALRRGLHDFAKPWYRLRAVNVFLDDVSMCATTGLRRDLESALSDASFLILLASPAAADSTWVAREVEFWRTHKKMDHLLIVLTEGDIVWDDESNDFDWERTTALPRTVMSGAFAEEPRYTELRWCRGDRDRVIARDARFQLCVADLAAPLHGKRKDALIGDDVRFHRRAVTLARGVVATMVAIIAALALVANVALVQRAQAVKQRNAAERASLEATRERNAANRAQTDLLREKNKAVTAGREAALQRQAAVEARDQAIREQAEAVEARRLATVQRNAAVRARLLAQARLLAAEAMQQSEENLDTALLLAVRAFRTLDMSATRDALTTVLRRSERVVAMARADGTIGAVSYSPARRMLALVDFGKGEHSARVRVWDVARRVPLWSAGIERNPSKLVFVERTGEIAVFGRDGITYFDAASGGSRGHVPMSFVFVPNAAVSADGQILTYFVYANGRHTLVTWDLAARRRRSQPYVTSTAEGAPRLAVSPHGSRLAVNDGGVVSVYDAGGGRAAVVRTGGSDAFAVSESGRVAAVSGTRLRIWSGLGVAESGELNISPTDPALEFDAGGDRVAVTWGTTTTVWRMQGLSLLRTPDWRLRLSLFATTVHVLGPGRHRPPLTYRIPHPSDAYVLEDVSISPVASDRVFAADSDGAALLDAASAKVLRTYPGMPFGIVDEQARAAVYFADTGDSWHLVVSRDGGRSAQPLPGLDRATATALSADGVVLAAALPGQERGDGTVVVRNLRTGRDIARLPGWDGGGIKFGGQISRALAISGDGRTVAYSNREGVAIWRDGRLGTMPSIADTYHVIDISEDGRRVAHNSRDDVIDIVDTTTMTVLGRLHTGYVWDIAFKRNEDVIATVGAQVTLWDTSTFERRAVVAPEGGTWTRVIFAGQVVVVSDGGSKVGFFPLDMAQLVQTACRLVGRALNAVETSQYIGESVAPPTTCAESP